MSLPTRPHRAGDVLTDAQVAAFDRDGFVTVDRIADDATRSTSWRDGYDELFARAGGFAGGDRIDLAPGGERPTLPQIVNPERYMPELVEGARLRQRPGGRQAAARRRRRGDGQPRHQQARRRRRPDTLAPGRGVLEPALRPRGDQHLDPAPGRRRGQRLHGVRPGQPPRRRAAAPPDPPRLARSPARRRVDAARAPWHARCRPAVPRSTPDARCTTPAPTAPTSPRGRSCSPSPAPRPRVPSRTTTPGSGPSGTRPARDAPRHATTDLTATLTEGISNDSLTCATSIGGARARQRLHAARTAT